MSPLNLYIYILKLIIEYFILKMEEYKLTE
jgi:hypothetical protein